MRRLFAIALLAMLTGVVAPAAEARGHGSYHGYRSHYGYSRHAYHAYSTRIPRSAEARREFETMSGYPHGRRGYVIDHIIPLACGGADAPSNMQWQTIAQGKAKDRWERKGCSRHR